MATKVNLRRPIRVFASTFRPTFYAFYVLLSKINMNECWYLHVYMYVYEMYLEVRIVT